MLCARCPRFNGIIKNGRRCELSPSGLLADWKADNGGVYQSSSRRSKHSFAVPVLGPAMRSMSDTINCARVAAPRGRITGARNGRCLNGGYFEGEWNDERGQLMGGDGCYFGVFGKWRFGVVAVRDLVLIILDVESLIEIVVGSGRYSGFKFGVAVGPF